MAAASSVETNLRRNERRAASVPIIRGERERSKFPNPEGALLPGNRNEWSDDPNLVKNSPAFKDSSSTKFYTMMPSLRE